jgi:hypothetical protein
VTWRIGLACSVCGTALDFDAHFGTSEEEDGIDGETVLQFEVDAHTCNLHTIADNCRTGDEVDADQLETALLTEASYVGWPLNTVIEIVQKVRGEQ